VLRPTDIERVAANGTRGIVRFALADLISVAARSHLGGIQRGDFL
jgi:hypothetical protein